MSDLRVYRVSTTALVTVHTTVKARDAEHALDVACVLVAERVAAREAKAVAA